MGIGGLMSKDREMCGALGLYFCFFFPPLEFLCPFKEIPVLQIEGKAMERMTTYTD